MEDKRTTESVVQEIMGLVDLYGEDCEMFGISHKVVNYNELMKSRAELQSKLRELVERCSVREPLTEQEIGVVIDTTEDESEYGHHHFGFFKDFARNVERAHNITNTTKE